MAAAKVTLASQKICVTRDANDAPIAVDLDRVYAGRAQEDAAIRGNLDEHHGVRLDAQPFQTARGIETCPLFTQKT
jgi:hypothetical protein